MDKRRQLAIRFGGVLLALGVVALIYTLVVDDSSENPDNGGESPGNAELQRYEDEVEGFALMYPDTWVQATARNEEPNVKLLLAAPGTDNAVSVSTVTFDEPVTIDARTSSELVSGVEDQLDGIVDDIPNVTELLQRRRIGLGDVQGWTYIYRFTDDTGDGIHVRHFFFRGFKMYMLIFQAFPEDQYGEMAPVFDEILASFEFLDRSTPEPATSPPLSDTTP